MIVATGQPVTLIAISGQATESPAGTFTVNDATSSGFAGVTVAGVPAGARWTVTADSGPASWGLYAYWRTAAGTQTGPTVHSVDPVTGAGTTMIDLPAKPADATSARLGIEIRSTGTGRVVQVTAASWTLTATTELLTAQLDRPLHRTAIDRITAAVPHIQAGTPGLLAGQITYLCDDLNAALALDAVYTAGPGVFVRSLTPDPEHSGLYLADGLVPDPEHPGLYMVNPELMVPVFGLPGMYTAPPLANLRHVAVGTIRMAAERATPGRPSKWLYTVEIREVP
ncbi:MAG: hypothetical protein QM695_16325 [Micropruina sp.]